MKKAFATIEVKSTREEKGKRIFTGIATTPTPDLDEDIMEPKGAVFQLPIPFLWQHNAGDPTGFITSAKVTSKGIEIQGEVPTVEEEGSLKDRLTRAWHELKYKLVRGLSVGFRVLESADIEGSRWGRHITKWLWLETSAVTIAANQEASIVNIKAALGHSHKPGVSGQNKGNIIMKNLHEQLAELQESRSTKAARMTEISEGITAKTATKEDRAEFGTLTDEVSDLDDQTMVLQAQIANAKTATHVAPVVPTAPHVIKSQKTDAGEKFKGQNFTRMIIAKAMAKLESISPVAVAQKRWGQHSPQLVQLIKAAVEGGGSGSGEWAAELVSADARYTGDFIGLLTAKTVFDKLPLREIPANVTIKGQDGAATGYWVGESNAINASAQSYSDVSLTPLKAAALAVISNELIRDSSPAAEQLVRDALVDASAQRVDTTFLSAAAAVAGVSPAGSLNGISADSASGTDADALRADILTLYGDFITGKNASGLQLVMNPALAKSIQMLYNALGNPEFPSITQDGGTLLGDPVVTGDNVNASHLILLRPADIYRIGDTGIRVELSREATIEMDDAPAMESQGPTTASGAMVGMFQTESTAIKVVRSINFARRRTANLVVGYIDDAAYDNSAAS